MMNSYTYGGTESDLLASDDDVSRYIGKSALTFVDWLLVQNEGLRQWETIRNDARFRVTMADYLIDGRTGYSSPPVSSERASSSVCSGNCGC